MSYITHPGAPEKDQAQRDAEELAEKLRADSGYRVRVDEVIKGRFEVVVEVPFRKVYRTWRERQGETE